MSIKYTAMDRLAFSLHVYPCMEDSREAGFAPTRKASRTSPVDRGGVDGSQRQRLFHLANTALRGGQSRRPIAARAASAGLTHVAIKIADAGNAFNIDKNGMDLIPPVVAALHAKGIQAWGWHYVYGYDPVAEAARRGPADDALQLDGYVIDAEAEYQYSGRAAVAETFCTQLRARTGRSADRLILLPLPRLPYRLSLEHFSQVLRLQLSPGVLGGIT